MARKIFSIFFLILFIYINVSSQSIIVPQTKLYEHLLRNTGTVFSIKSEFPNFSKNLLPLTDEFKEYTHDKLYEPLNYLYQFFLHPVYKHLGL